jgi:hypothetical protein
MQALLLLVLVLNGLELAEFDHVWIEFPFGSFFRKFLFKDFHEDESTFFMHLNFVVLLHEWNVFQLVRCHHKAQTLTCAGDTGRPTDSIHVLFDLT